MKNIPKKLHMYWDKGPMSKLQVFTVETFHRLNPDWEITVYVPQQIYTKPEKYIPDYTGVDFFDLLSKMSYVNIVSIDMNAYGISCDLHNILRSDILRYHLLYTEGGIWSDFDVIWFKPLDHLSSIIGDSNFMSVICTLENRPKAPMLHNISILISAPKQKLYKDLIDKCSFIQANLKGRSPNHQEFGTCMWNNMFSNSTAITKNYPGVVNVDYSTYFPYPIYQMKRLYKQVDLSVINDQVMCEHWFNGHVLSKEYVNLDLFNNPKHNCSMTEILKKEGYKG